MRWPCKSIDIRVWIDIIGNIMRIVLDTNVLVAGLASRSGASHQLLLRIFSEQVRLLVSVPLFLEYEATLKRQDVCLLHRLDHEDVEVFLNTLILHSDPVDLHFLWHPQLDDAKDEMVLETALNGQADALVTFNLVDFRAAAQRFGLDLLRPADLLSQLGRSSS